jgi:hypothetical protein
MGLQLLVDQINYVGLTNVIRFAAVLMMLGCRIILVSKSEKRLVTWMLIIFYTTCELNTNSTQN